MLQNLCTKKHESKVSVPTDTEGKNKTNYKGYVCVCGIVSFVYIVWGFYFAIP